MSRAALGDLACHVEGSSERPAIPELGGSLLATRSLIPTSAASDLACHAVGCPCQPGLQHRRAPLSDLICNQGDMLEKMRRRGEAGAAEREGDEKSHGNVRETKNKEQEKGNKGTRKTG